MSSQGHRPRGVRDIGDGVSFTIGSVEGTGVRWSAACRHFATVGEGCSSHAGGSTPAQRIPPPYGLLKGFNYFVVLECLGLLVVLVFLANSVFMRVSAGSAALRHPQRG